MATHNVKFIIPERNLVNEDARFVINRNGKKLREIRISKGSFDYYPSNSRIPIKLRWLQLDKLIREQA